MYIVKWESLETGTKGQGQPTTKDLAESWAKHENKKYDGVIVHWVERVDGD